MARSSFHCSLCPKSFPKKLDLLQHKKDHEQSQEGWSCGVCNTAFDDPRALEEHKVNTGHATVHQCDSCMCVFTTPALLAKHRRFPSSCSDAFNSKNKFSSNMPEAELNMASLHSRPSQNPSPALQQESPRYNEPSLAPPTITSDGEFHCHICKETFPSEARFNHHFLRCEPATGASKHEKVALESPRQTQRPTSLGEASRPIQAAQNMFMPIIPSLAGAFSNEHAPAIPQQRQPPTTSSPAASIPSVAATHICNHMGCQRSFRSEAGVKVHRQDVHGVDGRNLEMLGRDAWMLSREHRERLSKLGILRIPSLVTPSKLRTHQRAPTDADPTQQPLRPTQNATQGPPSMSRPHSPPQAPPMAATAPSAIVVGREEMDQAEYICRQIMRLVLQSDVFIKHDGRFECSGIGWTRIPVAKQADVAGLFGSLCHLPAILQSTEYVPLPKTFMDEYRSSYAFADFKHSPERIPTKPALSVVAICCSKIVLEDGLQEAVKVAAVDVISCRVLMSHLVCTDPKALVKEWRTNITGLSGFHDIEAARQDGYKVFKGWNAARAALWKFIDKETIIVGYNLRGDLDSLRMVHGRAVDVARLVEKAANGPLSKPQLSLESLCRDLPGIHLTNHSTFGRDCLQNAFAARELGLWMLKNNDKLGKWAKAKSLDYQRATPAARA